jgi:hypothetical protein
MAETREPVTHPALIVATVIGGVVALIGLVALGGSVVDSPRSTGWLKGRPEMTPLTSIALVCLGLAVVFAARKMSLAAAVGAAGALATVLAGVGVRRRWWSLPDALIAPRPDAIDPLGVSPVSTMLLVSAVAVALLLLVAGRVVASQTVAAVTSVPVYASIVAYLLGDRTFTIDGSSFPQTHTALPTVTALLLVAVGIVTVEPHRGIWLWMDSPGAGRAILRRVIAPLLLSPIAVLALVRGFDLEDHLGGPRADAVIVAAVTLLMLGGAVGAVREIDRLAEEARQREVADRLAAAHEAAAAQSERMALLASHLSASSSVGSITEALVSEGSSVLNAELVGLGFLSGERPGLWITRSIDGVVQEPIVEQLSGERSPSVDAFQRAEVVWLCGDEELERHYPGRLEGLRSAGIRSLVVHPLTSASGEVIGVLIVGWRARIEPDDALRSVTATLAEVCSQTVQRALLTDSEHRLIASLQERLVGRAPTLMHLDIDVRYQPAAEASMGGDWYDVVEDRDGRVTVVLGDVSGHGVEAVADMAQARTLIGALVRQGLALGDILHRFDDLVGRDDPIMATVALVRIDPMAGVLEHTCAGHPPIALRRPDGVMEFSEGGRHPLLGAGVDLVQKEPERHDFPPGAAVIIYSDGLVERRGEDLSTGLQRLLDVVASAPAGTASDIADHVLDKMLGGSGGSDDTALVVIRRSLSIGDGGRRVSSGATGAGVTPRATR